jgi:nitrate reductase alpha subunit
MKQFTDMPLLVRIGAKDPLKGKFLRTSDALKPDGSPVNPVTFNQYYVWDGNTNKAVLVSGTLNNPGTLDLGAVNPKLDGMFIAQTPSGPVQVATVFTLLKQKLAPFTIAKTAEICGLSPSLVTSLANDFATIKPARIIEGAGTNHWFHNDLTNRAQIMLLAVTGNVGKPGTGFDHYVGQEKIWPEAAWFQLSYPNGRPQQRFQNTTLWTYVHGESASDVDNLYPRPIKSYIKESVDKGWMPLWPKDTLDTGRTPKVMFIWGANYVNQAKGYNNLVNTLLPKLDMIIDVNVRMDTSALYADYVLPAASMFEKWDLNSTDLHTFMIPFTPVIDLQYECRTDWQIWQSIAGALAATGFVYDDVTPSGVTIHRDFTQMPVEFATKNVNGMNVTNDRDAAQFILTTAVETAGFTLDTGAFTLPRFANNAELESLPDSSIVKHPKRFTGTSEAWTTTIKPGVAYYGFQRMFEELLPLNTMVGRQQFYIDHDWYLKEFKEELPTYKGTVDADPYPLRWSTPHGRWSIHSTWRDAKFQLRLQRGRTVVYINPEEAATRGIKDNDLVRVYNGHGAVEVHVDISSRVPKGQAVMYHGWERYQHNTGWQAPTGIRINPTQLVGKYGQLAFRLNYWGPTGNQKDTRVEIVKV